MNQMDYLIQHLSKIEERIGYCFADRSHLILAFVHRSYLNENRLVVQHNERLEFLGDAVLGLLISDYLYIHYPDTPEGDLSYLRSRLVEANSCVDYIQQLDLSTYILLGKGERRNDGRGRDTILANLFESIIGAIYLDGGIQAAKRFLFDHFLKKIESILATPLKNWKALLQDYCQKNFQQIPIYEVMIESGPDHEKIFEIKVKLKEGDLGEGRGSSKKEAQQAAAQSALKRFLV